MFMKRNFDLNIIVHELYKSNDAIDECLVNFLKGPKQENHTSQQASGRRDNVWRVHNALRM